MDSPFSFDNVAAGSRIIGRENEVGRLVDILIRDKKGVAIASGPRSGKETIIKEGISRLESRGIKYVLCEINLFNTRTYDGFLTLFRSKMSECFEEVTSDSLLSFDFDLCSLPDRKVFELPAMIAQKSGKCVIVYFKEFENLLYCEGENFKLDELEKIWSKQTDVRYILTGSFVNSMKSIFNDRKLFYNMTQPLEVKSLDKKAVCEYIISSFLDLGRVIEFEEALAIYDISGGNMWYVKQMCSLCQSLPAGYINRRTVIYAKDSLISLHSTRFMQIMLDLTQNQINLLHAVVDEVPRFSSSEVLDKYQLNSSANVFRIKDALQKKEVIAFDADDNAYFPDPLFRYWLKFYYFS